MASSVASAREMEKWGREKREMKQKEVYMPREAKRNFATFEPNFDELEKFESKAQKLAQRQEDKEHEGSVPRVAAWSNLRTHRLRQLPVGFRGKERDPRRTTRGSFHHAIPRR